MPSAGLRRIREWARPAQGSFGHGVLTLAGGTAGVQALYLVSLPLLTRLFTVEEMGDFTVFQALLAVLLVVSAWRYEVAIFVAGDNRESANVLALSLFVVLASSVIVAGLLWGLAAGFELPARYAVIAQHWMLLWVALVGAGVSLVLTQWTLRERSFATVARARVSQVFFQVVAQVGLAFAWPAGPGLLVGVAFGRIMGCGPLVARLLRVDRPKLPPIEWPSIVDAARRYVQYPLFSAPGALLNTTTLQLPPILLLFMFGQDVAGWFGLMIRVSSAPMMLIGKSVSDAYAAEFSRLLRDNPAGLRRLFLSTFRRLALLGLGPLVVMLTAGPWLFQLVFGADWHEAGVYGRLAALYVFAEFCCFPLFMTLGLLKRQRVQFVWDGVLIVALLAGLWIIWSLGGGPRTAVAYYGLCFGVMYFAHAWLSFRMLRLAAVGVDPGRVTHDRTAT